jgi:hypothetical protein
MANYEITGRLFEKFSTQQVTDKYSKRELVIEVTENNYTQHIKLQLSKDRCALLDKFNVGDEIKAVFNLNGRRWEKDGKVSYFNTLDAWKLDLIASGGVQQADETNQPEFDDGENDLPF